MVEIPLIYTFADKVSDRELTAMLTGRGEVRVQSTDNQVRYYLDTFDWRLYRAGTVLEVATTPTGYLLNWRRLRSGEPLVTLAMKRLPSSVLDFSAPGIRARFERILGRRALETRIAVKSRGSDFSVLNRERKVVARLERRQDRVYREHSMEQVQLPEHVYLVPYRGYQGELEKVQRRIAADAKLVAADADPLELLVERLQLEPTRYESHPAFELRPEAPALDAMRQVQGGFLQVMTQNIPGACRGEDPEFLHDFLVAERRTRCMLNRYPEVFPTVGLSQLSEDLAWAEKMATPVRDLDIYLELVDEFLGKVDKAHRRDLKPLFHYLNGQKRREQRELQVALESPRFKRTLKRWGEYLNADFPRHQHPEEASTPIRAVVCRCVLELLDELVTEGRAVLAGGSDAALCELHQTSKKLGYQLEVFHSLFPESELGPLMEEHERLQRGLNRFRDLHVQHRTLGKYEQKMKLEQQAMPVAIEATDLLLARLGEERDAERQRVRKRFEKFARPRNVERFNAIFDETGRAGGSAP